MTNITQEVRDFLNQNPSIVKCLECKIINIRALAFHMIKNCNKGASSHAVMSAIRRYKKELKIKEKKKSIIQSIYLDSKISTKSHLVMFTLKRHFKILRNILPHILDDIHVSKGEVLRIVEGRESVKLIFDHSKKPRFLKIIPEEELIDAKENLGELNIHFSEKYGDMPGLVSPVFNELAINDVNVIEIIGCMPELIIIVKEEDISKCHDALIRFLYNKK